MAVYAATDTGFAYLINKLISAIGAPPAAEGPYQELIRRWLPLGILPASDEAITPLLADRIFDKGPEIVDVYEFGMSKLTEELDDETIAEYAKLLVQEDKYFTEMFGELSAWMNSLPQLPK